jgi:hypothetical protein
MTKEGLEGEARKTFRVEMETLVPLSLAARGRPLEYVKGKNLSLAHPSILPAACLTLVFLHFVSQLVVVQ